jgi:hypothetical protein
MYGGVAGAQDARSPVLYTVYAGQELKGVPRDNTDLLFERLRELRKSRLDFAWQFYEKKGVSMLPRGLDMAKLPRE